MSKKCFRIANVLLTLALVLVIATPAFADSPISVTGGDAGPLLSALRNLGKVVVDTLIGIAAILMVVGIASGFVAGQVLTTIGAPYGASTAMMRVLSSIALAIGAFLTVIIANTVIDVIAVPATEIPIPKPGGALFEYLVMLASGVS